MSTFADYLREMAAKGEAVNTVFEERLYELTGVLHRITHSLSSHGIPHELIGGLAVLVHVEEADATHSMLTGDVALLVNRADLDRIIAAASASGFRFRHTAGVDMLLYGETTSARNAVHLIFSGEKVRPDQATPNPPIDPVHKIVQGEPVMVVPIAGLVRMKLSSFRLKDQVHVQVMDAAGLITPEVERSLPVELVTRLEQVRRSE